MTVKACPDCTGEASIDAIVQMMWDEKDWEPIADRLCWPHFDILGHHWREFPPGTGQKVHPRPAGT